MKKKADVRQAYIPVSALEERMKLWIKNTEETRVLFEKKIKQKAKDKKAVKMCEEMLLMVERECEVIVETIKDIIETTPKKYIKS